MRSRPFGSLSCVCELERLIAAAVIGCGVLALAGCGSGDSGVFVHGRVSVDGRPVTVGQVMFHPNKGTPSLSTIDEMGAYEISGVMPGEYVVTIEAYETQGGVNLPSSLDDEMRNGLIGGSRPPQITWLVPRNFASKAETSLSTKVEQAKANEINFDL